MRYTPRMSEKAQIMLAMMGVCTAIGGLLVFAAAKDWNWFFRSVQYRLLVKVLGRKGARAVVGAIGVAILLIPLYLYVFKW